MTNSSKKYSLSLKHKPLFDDDLDLEEETKMEMNRTNSISILALNEKSPPFKKPLQNLEISELSKPYISYLRYILEKINANHLLAKPKEQEFIEKFLFCFEEKEKGQLLRKNQIKSLCSDNIPDICKRIRPLCWRILLDYLPEDRTKWKIIEENNKKLYEDHINLFLLGKNKQSMNIQNENQASQSIEFMKCNDHPLSKAKNSTWNTFFSDQNLWDEIEKDTKRTRKEINFFTLENKKNIDLKYPSLSKNKKDNKFEYHYEALTRILFVFAKKNQKIGYVQGMNEILAPIYFCFINDDKNTIFSENAEADSFICFSQLMNEIKDSFVKIQDSNKIGLELRMKDFNELFKKIDGRLFEFLKKNNICVQFFGFQWLLLMLSQEFLIDDVLKLWDGLFSNDNRKEYLNYLCIAILYILREDILNGDYSEILNLLQNLKKMDIRLIQEKGKNLYNEYVVYNENNK